MPADIRDEVKAALQAFPGRQLPDAARNLFAKLGYVSDRAQAVTTAPEFLEWLDADGYGGSLREKDRSELTASLASLHLLFQITDLEIGTALGSGGGDLFDSGKKVDGARIESYLFFAADLAPGAKTTRTALSQLLRLINKPLPMPALVLFRHGGNVSLAVLHRRLHKKQGDRDVLEKATLIRDIRLANPHRAHLEILADVALPALNEAHGPLDGFVALHKAWQKTLSIELLNRRFFREVRNWFYWARLHARFPAGARPDADGRHSESLIRLLTRLIFCWFLKEKGLIPDDLFEPRRLRELLSNWAPSESDSDGRYYLAVLQNLFFATLNTPVEERQFRAERRYKGANKHYGDHRYFRHCKLFAEKADIERLYKDIPFLNGGLFDCLDEIPGRDEGVTEERRVDGFSDTASKQPCIPDFLFFGGKKPAPELADLLDEKTAPIVRGLLDLFPAYIFTVEENTPTEEEIALDPELLGRVFENLLAAVNPETGTIARKSTGSFYTPREIVNYMVDEALVRALTPALAGEAATAEMRLRDLLVDRDASFTPLETNALITAIGRLKILDPACGSGAFPMGILHRLVSLLRHLDPENKRWKETKLATLPTEMREKARETFERETFDYTRKLELIRDCIHGVDIQPTAIQISKLRFFLSLVIEQKTTTEEERKHIRPLPNLDYQLMQGNSLLESFEGEPLDDLAPGSPYGVKVLGSRQHELALAAGEPELTEAAPALHIQLESLENQYFECYDPVKKIGLRRKIDAAVLQAVDARIDRRRADLTASIREWDKAETTKRKRVAGYHTPVSEQRKREAWQEELEGLADKQQRLRALLRDPRAERPFFLWHLWFRHILAAPREGQGGFDVVIGNPPYIDVKALPSGDAQVFFSLFSTAKNRINLYALFIEQSFGLLGPNGVLAFINPNSLLVNESYSKVRQLIVRDVTALVKLPDGVFENAIVETMLLFVQRNSQSSTANVAAYSTREPVDFANIRFTPCEKQDWLNDPEIRFSIFASADDSRVCSKLETSPLRFDNVCEFCLGITPYDKHKGHTAELIKSRGFHADRKLSSDYVPLIEGANIMRYTVSEAVSEWLKYGPWLSRPRERRFFTKPRVIVRQIASGVPQRIYAGFTDKPLYHSHVGFVILGLKKPIVPLKVLLALLNSKLLNFYHERRFLDREKITFQKVLIANVKMFPITIPSDDVSVSICKLVDEIIAKKQRNSEFDSSVLEAEIDKHIYSLYGLTPEEIEIVEQSSAPPAAAKPRRGTDREPAPFV